MIEVRRLYDSIPHELKQSITLRDLETIACRYNSSEKSDSAMQDEAASFKGSVCKKVLYPIKTLVVKLSELPTEEDAGVTRVSNPENKTDLDNSPICKKPVEGSPACPRCASYNTFLRPPSKLCVGRYYKCNDCCRGFSYGTRKADAADETEAPDKPMTDSATEGQAPGEDISAIEEAFTDWLDSAMKAYLQTFADEAKYLNNLYELMAKDPYSTTVTGRVKRPVFIRCF